MVVCLFLSVCLLAELLKYYCIVLPEKNQKMGLSSTKIPLSDLDDRLDTKKIIRIFPFTYYYVQF